MKFENTDVWGFEHALRGMRNPKNSWHLSDSQNMSFDDPEFTERGGYWIGPKDMKLAQALIKGGPEHRKFLRQIFVSVDITAPLYWWKEFDTYKVGTVANSTSTMHKLMSKPITRESFEMDDYNKDLIVTMYNENGLRDWYLNGFIDYLIEHLESLRFEYLRYDELIKNPDKSLETVEELEAKQYQVWKELIRWLPESWLQTRTVTMTYENLLAMCSKSQRRPHKLNEWSGKRNPDLENFIKWARTLPYAQEFIFFDELVSPGELCSKYLREISSKLNHGPTFHHYGISVAFEDGKIKPINVLLSELANKFDKKEKI